MILVTGATGFIGREVVRELYAIGQPVRLLVRDPKKAEELIRRYNCEYVIGDVLRPETLVPAMEGVQAAVHLVGIIAETPRVSFEQAHIDATTNMVLAARHAGVKRFVHMSALGTRPWARSRYHRSKWGAEWIVIKSELDWTILRPSVVFGPGDRSINALATVMRLPFGLVPNLGGGWSRVQPVAVGDLARCVAHTVGDPATIKVILAPCGPQSLYWRELLGVVATTLKKKYVFDEWGALAALRILFWIVALLLPLVILLAAIFGGLTLFQLAALGVIWAIAVSLCANAGRNLIFFNVPLPPLIAFFDLFKDWIPRWLQFGEQLKMLQEDSEAGPEWAARAFHFSAMPFAAGVAKNFKT